MKAYNAQSVMRKALLVVSVTLGLAAAALAVFLLTFDADRYRPMLVNQLQDATGCSIRLERVDLSWRHGIAVRLQGLTIANRDAVPSEPLIEVETINAVVRLVPLLKRELQVASIILTRPRIHVSRDAKGTLNLMGLAPVATPAAGPTRTAVGGTTVVFEVASAVIEGGTMHWTDAMTTPPAEVWLRSLGAKLSNIGPGRPMRLEATGALAAERANVRLTARVTPPTPTHSGAVDQLELVVEDVSIERVAPTAQSEQPRLLGVVTASVEGALPTLDLSQLRHALSGDGQLRLAEGRIANLNVLRTVFEKCSMIPGLVEQLETRLPETYRAKLAANDTMLAPLEVSMRVEDGALKFHDLQIGTDTFHLAGAGSVTLEGAIAIRATLRMEPQLSEAIVRSVHELGALKNASGEIELPVMIQGRAPQIAVLPDLNYLASRVIMTKAVDLIGDLLQKHDGGSGGSEGASAAQEDTTGASQPSEDLLGHVLQRVLQKQSRPTTQSQ